MKPVPATAIEAFRRDPRQYESAKTLLDAINGARTALEVGTYAEHTQYRKWGSIFVPSWGMEPGSSAPVSADFTRVRVPQFVPGDSLGAGVEIPPDFLPAGGLRPSLHFSFDTATGGGDVVTWSIEVNVGPRGSVFPAASWTYEKAYRVLDADLYRECVLKLPLITLPIAPYSLLIFTVQRQAGATTADPFFFGTSFAYQKGPFGSEAEP